MLSSNCEYWQFYTITTADAVDAEHRHRATEAEVQPNGQIIVIIIIFFCYLQR